MAKDWTDKETSYLKRYGSTKTLEELAQRFETDKDAVQAKLAALGLGARDSPRESRLGREPLLATYEDALKALHGGKVDKAQKAFTKVAEECDQPELAERARQYLRVCEAQDGGGGEVEPEDDFLAAVYEKNRGRFERSLAIARKGGRTGKDDRFTYLEASIHVLEDRLDEAAESLEKAISMNPKNRVYAFHDPDFEPLRESPEHSEIFRVP